MRIETITKELYQFEELSESAQKTAIEDNRYIEVEYDEWFYYTKDWMIEVCSALGFEVDNAYFSGFWSQGDGASLEGNFEYRKGWQTALASVVSNTPELIKIGENLQAIQKRYFYAICGTLTNRAGIYCHSNMMDITAENNIKRQNNTYTQELTYDVERELLCEFRSLADWYYSTLEKEYEYKTSDDEIKASLISNEMEFDSDGNNA